MPDLTAALHREEDWYTAQCLEVDVASQGHTIDEALANLAEAVELYLEEVDDPAGHLTATPLVTTFRLLWREPPLSDLPVRKVVRALESFGFSHMRTKGEPRGVPRALGCAPTRCPPRAELLPCRYGLGPARRGGRRTRSGKRGRGVSGGLGVGGAHLTPVGKSWRAA
jgi:predicted RNase H-like HicB family nuclease